MFLSWKAWLEGRTQVQREETLRRIKQALNENME